MSELARAQAIEAIRRNGGKIPDVPDGPRLETFAPLTLAQAIEYEINRCASMGWDQITLHMTIDDASRLAAHLRQNPILRKVG